MLGLGRCGSAKASLRCYGSCAIVGMPNIGKSTLFNALTRSQLAEASNYPFCTIKPNRSLVAIPDSRLDGLAAAAHSKRTVYSQMEFVDVAGLVRGASKGVGLGNQFLSHIRGSQVVLHALRCFAASSISHVETTVDPVRGGCGVSVFMLIIDCQIVESELVLSDLEQKHVPETEQLQLRQVHALLENGKYLSRSRVSEAVMETAQRLQLLTAKPVVFVCHVDEDEVAKESNPLLLRVRESLQINPLVISPKLEQEGAGYGAELEEFLQLYGLSETGLRRVVRACREQLDLITFYSVGPKEAHSWTMRRGKRMLDAAGTIHSDFVKGFVRARVVSSDDFLEFGGEEGCQKVGRVRSEGKESVCNDGDVCNFLIQ